MRIINSNSFLASAGTIAFVATAFAGGDKVQRPNVIYIFPDQMRNHAMEFWNEPGFSEHVNFTADPVKTPVLNKLARESLVLSRTVSNCPLSSPHRGMLLSGAYPQVNCVTLNCNSTRPISSLSQNIETLSDVLKSAGYSCAYIGKLHTDFPTPNDPQRPGNYVEQQRPVWDAYTPPQARHGFDYWYSYGTYDVHKQPHYWDTKGERHEIREWSPQHETDKAIEYLANKNGQRNPSAPFLMMVSMNPPHHPYSSLDDCMERDYNLYKEMPIEELLIRGNADRSIKKAESVRYYFAAISGIDREVGRILAELRRLKLDRNTIVVFSSDHGDTMCSQGVSDAKNSPYTEALNVPFIIRYPGKITPRVDSILLSTPDIMPTLLGLCQLSDRIPQTVQGRNFANLVLGKKTDIQAPLSALYIRNLDGETDSAGIVKNYMPISRGIKTAQYTFVLNIDRKTGKLQSSMLFDDRNDPYQLHNIPLEQNPELTQSLLKMLADELKRTIDPWSESLILKEMIPY